MLDAGVDLGDVQIAAYHADPRNYDAVDRARQNLDRHRTPPSPPAWPLAPDPARVFRGSGPWETSGIAELRSFGMRMLMRWPAC